MLLLLSLFVAALCGRPVPEYEINLDLSPDQRFLAVLKDFNVSLTALYNDVLTNDAALKKVLFDFAAQRGPETAEYQGEIEGVAKATNLPVEGIHALQFLYELGTLMIPIENVTIPWKGPGCTGIVAADKNGSVYHGRNLDFSPGHYMQKIVYNGKFTKGGQEVFRAQMMAGYSCVVTGMKMGANGFSLESNTRFPETKGDNEKMIHNLLVEKRTLNGWTVRKALETAPDFESAVQALSTTPYVAPMYNILSGVRKGAILARDPDTLAFQLTLGKSNPQCRSDYIIMTNFDFWWGDIREWFDPTAGEIGHPRRLIAQAILNATSPLTPEVITSALNAKGVLAFDTVFQAMINVEKGLWNLTLPDLTL